MSYWKIHKGDALDILGSMRDESIDCCITSPPYWGLRDYGVPGQIGMEPTFQEYVAKLVTVFSEIKRVLKSDGTLWLNLGDSYHNGDKGGYAKDRVTAQDSVVGSFAPSPLLTSCYGCAFACGRVAACCRWLLPTLNPSFSKEGGLC